MALIRGLYFYEILVLQTFGVNNVIYVVDGVVEELSLLPGLSVAPVLCYFKRTLST